MVSQTNRIIACGDAPVPALATVDLETAVDRFLALESPYELQLLCAPARSPQG